MEINAIKCKEVMQRLEDNPVYPSPIFFTNNAVLHGEVEPVLCDNETIYQCIQLNSAGLIVGELIKSESEYQIFRADHLTSLGHDILDKLNDNSVWTKIKDKLATIRSIAEFINILRPIFPPGWLAF